MIADEKDMMNGIMNIKIMFQNRIYNSDWKCESDGSQRSLYPNLRNEYTDNLDEAMKKWEEITVLFHTQPQTPTPQPTPQPTSKLEELFAEVLAKQSVDQVIEMAKPMLKNTSLKNSAFYLKDMKLLHRTEHMKFKVLSMKDSTTY